MSVHFVSTSLSSSEGACLGPRAMVHFYSCAGTGAEPMAWQGGISVFLFGFPELRLLEEARACKRLMISARREHLRTNG